MKAVRYINDLGDEGAFLGTIRAGRSTTTGASEQDGALVGLVEQSVTSNTCDSQLILRHFVIQRPKLSRLLRFHTLVNQKVYIY